MAPFLSVLVAPIPHVTLAACTPSVHVTARGMSSSSSRSQALHDRLSSGPGLDDFITASMNHTNADAIDVAAAAKAAAKATQPPLDETPEEAKRRRRLAQRKPSWLKATAPQGANYKRLKSTVKDLKLATVCEEARCPNIGECWGGRDGTGTQSQHVAKPPWSSCGPTADHLRLRCSYRHHHVDGRHLHAWLSILLC